VASAAKPLSVALPRVGAASAADARSLGRAVLGIAIGLTALGQVMIYSSMAVKTSNPGALLGKQAMWVGVAGLVGWLASVAPLDRLRRHSHHALLVVLVLLCAVKVVGTSSHNSRRWLTLGSLSIQPSEFLKVAVILYLSDRLARRDDDPFPGKTPWPALLAPIGVGIALVLWQPDLGTSLFVAALMVVLLGLAGVRPGHLVPLAAVVLPVMVGIAAAKFRHVGDRLEFLTKGADASPQLREAVNAVGSGGWLGAGLGAGTQKLWRVPEMQTDFIFALIGEELGFVGCLAVILAFMAFVTYGKRIAERAHDAIGPFGFYVAAGATFAVTFQALINIAVVLACAPTKGVPLPFISLGGSNLVTCAACVGLVANVAKATARETSGDPWAA
jgi:cell division protein FtsW